MDLSNPLVIVEGADVCAKELIGIVEGLPAEVFGGDLSRDFIVEACNRVENFEPRECKIEFPLDFLPTSRLPRTVVGVLGDTGVGKSKLLNVLLEKNLLPTSSSKRGTSFPTILIYHPHPTIEAAVKFMSKEDFAKHVETAIELVQEDEDGKYLIESSLKQSPSYSLLNEALGLHRDDFAEDGASVDTILAKCPEVIDLLGQTQYITADNEKEFLRETAKRYTRRTGHSEYKKWPLVDLMVIKCDSELLSKGVILVDLPGSSDVSATVMRATEGFKDKLQFILGAARVERSEDDAELSSYIEEEVARQRRMQGNNSAGDDENHASLQPSSQPSTNTSALAVIITKCDSTTNVKLDELEADHEIGPLLRGDRQYLLLRKHCKLLESRINKLERDEDADSDVDELASDDEDWGSLSDDSQTRKRSQPYDPADVVASKRRKTDAEGGSDPVVKVEASGSRPDDSSARMDVDQNLDADQLKMLLNDCRRNREILAAGVRSQVICRTVRKQYKDQASETLIGEIGPLPVFATSAGDYAETKKKKFKQLADLERTGIPAIRAFIRNLGAREQYSAALNLIQPFRAQVTSVLDILSTVEVQGGVEADAQHKQALKERWASRVPLESAASQSNDATASQVKPSTCGIQSTLKAALSAILQSEIRGVRRKLVELAAACNRPLVQLAEEHVPQITAEIVQTKQHWATWRAVLRHDGISGKINWNRTLAKPLVDSMKPKREDLFSQWNNLVGTNLRNKLYSVGVQVLNEIIRSATATGCGPSLLDSVTDHVNRSIPLIDDRIQQLQHIVAVEILDVDERASRPNSLNDAARAWLVDIYKRALKITGKNSTVRQKDFLEEAINERADTMFADIVKEFIQARKAAVDRVEAQLMEALDQTAKDVELAISPVWAVVGHDAEQVAARARASEAVSTICGRLVEMESALKTEMKRAEEVPSCYPPPAIPVIA
ncbi:hypothetical protein PENSPDRAFT_37249 [Peniophora sp. CONT]|nr:hypothetical protein PENSPDRAFT_37249 [Peniophora sp. CONT]